MMGPSVHPNPAKSKNVSVTVMAMFELESELTVGEGAGKGEKRVLFIAPSLPSPSFRPSLTPLVLISFSSQPSAIVKIKDGSYDFDQDNTEHSSVRHSAGFRFHI